MGDVPRTDPCTALEFPVNQKKKKRSPRLSHLCGMAVQPAPSHVGPPTHWRGEAGDSPKARVASPANQFSATSGGARRGAPIAVLQSAGFVTVELWQRRLRVTLNICSRRDYGADLGGDEYSPGGPGVGASEEATPPFLAELGPSPRERPSFAGTLCDRHSGGCFFSAGSNETGPNKSQKPRKVCL